MTVECESVCGYVWSVHTCGRNMKVCGNVRKCEGVCGWSMRVCVKMVNRSDCLYTEQC